MDIETPLFIVRYTRVVQCHGVRGIVMIIEDCNFYKSPFTDAILIVKR